MFTRQIANSKQFKQRKINKFPAIEMEIIKRVSCRPRLLQTNCSDLGLIVPYSNNQFHVYRSKMYNINRSGRNQNSLST